MISSWIKRNVPILAFVLALGVPTHAGAAESEAPSVLPTMRISTDLFKITFAADPHGIVDSAEVTSVLPNSAASKRNIEVQDELLEIDHHPIKGMRYADAERLINNDLKPGEKRVFTFQGRRGLLAQKRIRYEFVVVGRS